MTDEIKVTPLLKIDVEGGPVRRGIKASSESFTGFGELYFSEVDHGAVKAWKVHLRMTMNLIVVSGVVRFIFCKNPDDGFKEILSDSESSYQRITVPPGYWFGFQGVSEGTNLVCNLASIEHCSDEVKRKTLNEIAYDWPAL